MRVETHCKCGKIYVNGEGESSFEGYLPLPPGEHYTSETCSSCRPDLDPERRQLQFPCPQCGESGHGIEYVQEGLSIVCPLLPEGVYLWLMADGKILRDNRAQFKPKQDVSDSEFPEFLDDRDWFDAHTTIEI